MIKPYTINFDNNTISSTITEDQQKVIDYFATILLSFENDILKMGRN